MSNHDELEKQLRSWTPRRASGRVAQRLFGTRGSVSIWSVLRTPELLHWLTPAAACLVTMLVFLSGGYQRSSQSAPSECATFYATVMMNASHESNSLRHTFAMGRRAVNMEWNVIPGFSYDATNPNPVLEPVNFETNALAPRED